jgi:hypothetical protein
MTDAQLYLAIGLPTIVVTLGMIGNGFLFNALSARMSSLEAGMLGLDAKLDLPIGKVADISNRLSVLEL